MNMKFGKRYQIDTNINSNYSVYWDKQFTKKVKRQWSCNEENKYKFYTWLNEIWRWLNVLCLQVLVILAWEALVSAKKRQVCHILDESVEL